MKLFPHQFKNQSFFSLSPIKKGGINLLPRHFNIKSRTIPLVSSHVPGFSVHCTINCASLSIQVHLDPSVAAAFEYGFLLCRSRLLLLPQHHCHLWHDFCRGLDRGRSLCKYVYADCGGGAELKANICNEYYNFLRRARHCSRRHYWYVINAF